MFTTLTNNANSFTENDNLYNAILKVQQTTTNEQKQTIEMFLLNQLVLAACTSLNTNQTMEITTLNKTTDNYFFYYQNDVTSSINEMKEEKEEDLDCLLDDEVVMITEHDYNLNKKESLDKNRFKQQQQEHLDVDCNLASLASCLSSSSSTSSLSSSSSLTVKQKTSQTNSEHLSLINRKVNLLLSKPRRKQSKSSSSIIPYLTSSKKYLSSSNDCLSSDEGYFGSFSDTFLNKLKPASVQTDTSDDLVSDSIQIPPIFNTITNDLDDDTHFNSLITSNESDNNFEFYPNSNNWMGSLCLPKICLQCFKLNDSLTIEWNQTKLNECASCCFDNNINELLHQLNRHRLEQAEQDEIELRSLNWRLLVDKQNKQNRARQELNEEDLIDCMAYLNEIEMNLDYFQSDNLLATFDLLLIDDGFLKFKTNQMAFNLRKYHSELEHLKRVKSNQMMNMFANVHMDSIPEFIPVPSEYYDDELENEDYYDLTYCEQDYQTKDENDFTLIEPCKDDLSTSSSATTTISEQIQPEQETDQYEYYYENEQDYELYEDQLLIDSLTEHEAITLLRNESELYALQMAQASKSGLIKKQKNQKETAEDIFENVFNYDESVEDFNVEYESDLDSDTYESTNGQISISLRNSLMKLRHTRRHLAKLIESESLKTASSPIISHLSKQMSSVSRKPCVYMLNEGRCMRADCRFAHDLKQITCKYWLDGECLKGDNCEFLHELVEETPKLSSKHSKTKEKIVQLVKKDFKLDTEEFPVLGGTKSATSAKLVTSLKTAASVLSSNTSKQQQQQQHQQTQAVNIVAVKAVAQLAKKKTQLSCSSSSSCSSSVTTASNKTANRKLKTALTSSSSSSRGSSTNRKK